MIKSYSLPQDPKIMLFCLSTNLKNYSTATQPFNIKGYFNKGENFTRYWFTGFQLELFASPRIALVNFVIGSNFDALVDNFRTIAKRTQGINVELSTCTYRFIGSTCLASVRVRPLS